MARRIVVHPRKPRKAPTKLPEPEIAMAGTPVGEFHMQKYLFEKQLDFVQDSNPFKIAVCSRRSGKTVACAAHLVDTAIRNPEVNCFYITLSRGNAEKIVWPEITRLNNYYGLGGQTNNTKLSMTFPNGSIIYLSGAHDVAEIENFRGLSMKLVYIDECQSFRAYIEELIDDIIAPALLDHAGSLCLIGTPGPIPAGYFAEVAGAVPEKISRADAWSKHGWTFFDNPHVAVKAKKTHQELLQRELKRRGVSLEDPTIQREFFGKWVLDSECLWIRYYPDRCHYQMLPSLTPPHEYNYILGVDLGFNDADALAVLAWSSVSKDTYLVEEVVTNKQGLTELVEQIHMLQKKYPFYKMVIDEGGLGKKMAEEMRRRYHIPVQPADKARKQETVEFLKDALRTGVFKAKSGSKFAQDCNMVEIDRDKTKPDRIKLSDKYHSDIIDAVLYAFKESPAFTYQQPTLAPKFGSKEWADQQQTNMFEAAKDFFAQQDELNRRFNGNY